MSGKEPTLEEMLACRIFTKGSHSVQTTSKNTRGWMGGGTEGGGDPDDSDRDGEHVEAWIRRTDETGILDFDALRKAAAEEGEHYLDVLTDEVGKREEMIRELHGQLSCLCAAIETHPIEQENAFVRQERERARKLLGHYDVSEMRNRRGPSWQEIAKALSHGYEALRQVRPSGHDGDEDSNQCDEDCDLCAVDAAMAHLDDMLGKVCRE